MLVDNGGDVNSLDNMHHTPIIVSSYYAKSDISAFLVEKVCTQLQLSRLEALELLLLHSFNFMH